MLGSVNSGCRGGSRQRAAAHEHHQLRARPWVPLSRRGRPEVPRHVRPSGHGGVSGTCNGDGGRMDREREQAV
jgi:hypothetical protein